MDSLIPLIVAVIVGGITFVLLLRKQTEGCPA